MGKKDFEKSALWNTITTVENLPLTGYVNYAENPGKIAKGINKVGGNLAIGATAFEMYSDYQVYSGHNLYNAWGFDLIPVAGGIIGGYLGGTGGVMAGASTGLALSIVGDYVKDKLKATLMKDEVDE